jgi:hypothetical protein
MLTSSTRPVEQIGKRCGFGSAATGPAFQSSTFRAGAGEEITVDWRVTALGGFCTGDVNSGASAADKDMLWPPNHKFHDISVVGVTDPEGDVFTIYIDAVRQDEGTNGDVDALFHAVDPNRKTLNALLQYSKECCTMSRKPRLLFNRT